uniref:Uncharacterized protein n=1 Tax=Panagrolaimus sp. ES5 TaxID=591445 RepID=A0AC34FK75_9BILA
MNEVEMLSVIPATKNKNAELLTFNKAHELQHDGYCKIKANEFNQSVIIEQDGEKDRFAPISREFIRVKKSKYNFTAPQESVLQQLYQERFLTPLLSAAERTQNERLKEIAKLLIDNPIDTLNKDADDVDNAIKDAKLSCSVKSELKEIAKLLIDTPVDTLNKDADDVDNDIEDVKPGCSVKSELSPASGSTPPIDNDDRCSKLTTDSLPSEVLNESLIPSTEESHKRKQSSPSPDISNDNDTVAEPPNKILKENDFDDTIPIKKILYSSSFHLSDDKTPPGIDNKLHVYSSCDKKSWYEFMRDGDKDLYFCNGCQNNGKLIEAEIHLYEGEYFVTVDDVEHICKELTQPPNNETIEESVLGTISHECTENAKFEFRRKTGNDEDYPNLIIFDENDKEMCYLYDYEEKKKVFHCGSCQSMGNFVEAKISSSENVKNIIENGVHICSSVPYSTLVSTSEKVCEFSENDVDQRKGAVQDCQNVEISSNNPSVNNVTESSADIDSQKNNDYETVSEQMDDSEKENGDVSKEKIKSVTSPPKSPRMYNPREIFGPEIVIPKSKVASITTVPKTIITIEMPVLEPLDMQSSSSPSGENVPHSHIDAPPTSDPNPINKNISSPTFIYSPVNGYHPFNTRNSGYVPRTFIYTLPTYSPSINANNSRTSANVSSAVTASPAVNHMYYSNPQFQSSSINTAPRLATNSANRFMRPTFYGHQQFYSNHVGSNLAFSNAPSTSSQSNIPMGPGGGNNGVQTNLNFSSAIQVPPSATSFNNYLGESSDISDNSLTSDVSDTSIPSTSSRTNENPTIAASSLPSPILSNNNQNVATASTSSGMFCASNEIHVNGLLIKGDNFVLSPNQKGVPNMKLEVIMPSKQTYNYTFYVTQDAYHCDKCRQKGQKTSAKLCQLPSGEICVMLDEKKHICTMPYTNEILLYSGYEITKTDGGLPTLTVFDSINMDLGYEYQNVKSSTKFTCKNCERLNKKDVSARICVDEKDVQCIALNTVAHECKMLNFVRNGKIIKQGGYKKIKTSNGEEEIMIIYGQNQYRKFVLDPSTNDYYCLSCKNDGGKNTFIKIQKDKNDQEFLFACGFHWCKPFYGPHSSV